MSKPFTLAKGRPFGESVQPGGMSQRHSGGVAAKTPPPTAPQVICGIRTRKPWVGMPFSR